MTNKIIIPEEFRRNLKTVLENAFPIRSTNDFLDFCNLWMRPDVIPINQRPKKDPIRQEFEDLAQKDFNKKNVKAIAKQLGLKIFIIRHESSTPKAGEKQIVKSIAENEQFLIDHKIDKKGPFLTNALFSFNDTAYVKLFLNTSFDGIQCHYASIQLNTKHAHTTSMVHANDKLLNILLFEKFNHYAKEHQLDIEKVLFQEDPSPIIKFISEFKYAKLMQQSMLHSPIILRNHLIQAYIDQQELESEWHHVISVNY